MDRWQISKLQWEISSRWIFVFLLCVGYSKVHYTTSFRYIICSSITSFTNCLSLLICSVGKMICISVICIHFIPGHIAVVWGSAKWWNWVSNIWNMGYATTLYDNFERHRTWWKIKGRLTGYIVANIGNCYFPSKLRSIVLNQKRELCDITVDFILV
jgi:hypothetical protein